MCEKLLHHHFTLTTYQLRCQNLRIVHRIQNLQKILAHFLGVRLPQTCLSQKRLKNLSFPFESVLKLELWNIKSQLSLKLLVFLEHDMKRCVLPFFGQPIHTWSSFHGKFGHKDKKCHSSHKV